MVPSRWESCSQFLPGCLHDFFPLLDIGSPEYGVKVANGRQAVREDLAYSHDVREGLPGKAAVALERRRCHDAADTVHRDRHEFGRTSSSDVRGEVSR